MSYLKQLTEPWRYFFLPFVAYHIDAYFNAREVAAFTVKKLE